MGLEGMHVGPRSGATLCCMIAVLVGLGVRGSPSSGEEDLTALALVSSGWSSFAFGG